jgi:two-component system cell cycle sensor histidine kinase/response regulator CckA
MSDVQGRPTVLIVDDNKAMLGLLAEMLKWSGQSFTILAASDGALALNVAEKHNGIIDLLISDVDMPNMRGPELARAIRMQRPGIKVLLISGLGEVCHDQGWRFLSKPFDANQLMEQVGTLLHPRQSG